MTYAVILSRRRRICAQVEGVTAGHRSFAGVHLWHSGGELRQQVTGWWSGRWMPDWTCRAWRRWVRYRPWVCVRVVGGTAGRDPSLALVLSPFGCAQGRLVEWVRLTMRQRMVGMMEGGGIPGKGRRNEGGGYLL